ncbi:MAG: agmatine deiminase family protein [Anaerolineae bacterium]
MKGNPTHRLLPTGWHSVALYANSLLLNQRVLLCQCGPGFEKYDEQAIEVYRKALPEYEIIPIDCSLLSNGGGGINCAMHEIPDVGKLVDR